MQNALEIIKKYRPAVFRTDRTQPPVLLADLDTAEAELVANTCKGYPPRAFEDRNGQQRCIILTNGKADIQIVATASAPKPKQKRRCGGR